MIAGSQQVLQRSLLFSQGLLGQLSFVDFALQSLVDPLEFGGEKPYSDKLASAAEKTGLPEAVVCGRASIADRSIVLAVMDFRFIGASMGSVVGEKIARAFELATAQRLPIIIVTASGGARMQEGMLSLMQMAKTSAAARRHAVLGAIGAAAER